MPKNYKQLNIRIPEKYVPQLKKVVAKSGKSQNIWIVEQILKGLAK